MFRPLVVPATLVAAEERLLLEVDAKPTNTTQYTGAGAGTAERQWNQEAVEGWAKNQTDLAGNLSALKTKLDSKLSVDIVGAGPVGLWLAGELLAQVPKVAVTVYEKRTEDTAMTRGGTVPLPHYQNATMWSQELRKYMNSIVCASPWNTTSEGYHFVQECLEPEKVEAFLTKAGDDISKIGQVSVRIDDLQKTLADYAAGLATNVTDKSFTIKYNTTVDDDFVQNMKRPDVFVATAGWKGASFFDSMVGGSPADNRIMPKEDVWCSATKANETCYSAGVMAWGTLDSTPKAPTLDWVSAKSKQGELANEASNIAKHWRLTPAKNETAMPGWYVEVVMPHDKKHDEKYQQCLVTEAKRRAGIKGNNDVITLGGNNSTVSAFSIYPAERRAAFWQVDGEGIIAVTGDAQVTMHPLTDAGVSTGVTRAAALANFITKDLSVKGLLKYNQDNIDNFNMYLQQMKDVSKDTVAGVKSINEVCAAAEHQTTAAPSTSTTTCGPPGPDSEDSNSSSEETDTTTVAVHSSVTTSSTTRESVVSSAAVLAVVAVAATILA